MQLAKQVKRHPQAVSDASRKPDGTQQSSQAGAADAAQNGFIALALCHEDGRLLHIAHTLIDALAYPEEDTQPHNLFDLLADPHDKAIIAEELRASGNLQEFQTSLHHASGTIIPVLLTIHPFTCRGENLLMVLMQGYDSRSVKQRQTEARYQLIFNSVPVGIAITDRQGGFYAFNPAFNEMLGYSLAELREATAAKVYQDADDRKRFVEALYRDKTVRNFETAFVSKGGRAINVLLNSDLIDFGHLENAMLSSVRDITPLKSIEAKLIRERNFSETVLDTSESLIMVIAGDGAVIKFNKACEKTTGYKLAEIAGKPFWDLVSADPELARTRIRQMAEERRNDNFESYWKTKDGRLRLITWANVLLKDEDGKDYIVSTGSDITERRKAHEAVREANRELEQSLKRLEERNRAISMLADMEGFLQGCRTVEEACTICAQFVQSICPETSGAIYLINALSDMAEARETWGDENVSQTLFTPSNCWSARRRHLNLIDSDHRGLPCQHIRAVPDGQYLCIPMEAGGETLGVLHVSFIPGIADEMFSGTAAYFESRLRLLTAAAETAALSLSNIMMQNTLRQQSIRDALTGIYNRRYMEESLTRELSRAQREQAAVSALMFDIDHFKDFNDTYGHDGGDTLLKCLGDFLRHNTRGEDIVCRYGGEEFVVVLPNTRHQNAMQKAEALRISVKEMAVSHLSAMLPTCTISIGVATFPQHGQTADALLKTADEALYTAKREGRNRVVSGEAL